MRLVQNLMVDWEDEKHLHNLFFGRWVMADPDHVPAGRYGKQALENLGCWDNLKNRLIPALDAAAAANILALGEVPVGLLYNTDVCNNPALRVAATLPESVHEPIIYPVAAMSNSQSARQFVKFLAAEPQLKLFRAHGFQIVKGR